MPIILVKTKHPSLIPMLYQHRKPGYELIPVEQGDSFSALGQYQDIHAVIVDENLTNPPEIQRVKAIMDDSMFPVILITTGKESLSHQEAGMWLSCGVTDIFQLPMPAPLMGKRLGSNIQLYCVTQSLHGQVTDKLTGLHNREAFYHFAKRMMEDAPEDDFTVILSDIDNFKRINERFGEVTGDRLLKYVGGVLDQMNNEDCLFARYGGDQFVGILRENKPNEEIKTEFLDKAMEKFYAQAPISQFTVQFGIYEKVDKSLPVSILCDRALMALNTIKHQYGHIFALYTQQLQQKIFRQQQILDSMEQALHEKQFKIYYQPKHDLNSSKINGAEALVRWNHPIYGFMSPADFIPLFEESGFIKEVDKYVWEQVCFDMKKALQAGIPMVPISVNASRKDFLSDSMISFVREILKKYQLEPELFHMEITETAYVEEEEIISPIVNELRESGVKIELDDFGSGFSSLGIFSKLPVDIIKLDISLVKNMEEEPAIVDSVIRLMHNLGCEVTAEGVDHGSQAELLRKLGCDNVQGFYYSKPLTYEGFCEYILCENGERKS